MSKIEYSKGATIPVVAAIVFTTAACGLCLVAYNILVAEPKASASTDAQVSSVDADPDVRATSEAHRADNREQNTLRTAVLLRALANARDARDDESEDEDDQGMLRDKEEAYRPSEEEIAAIRQAEMDTMEKQFEGEPVDRDWAAKTEEAAAAAFDALEDNLELEEVICRKTVCRAQMTHHDPNTRRGDIDRLLSTPALGHQMTSYVLPDDERTTVMYFAREGHTLSVLSPPLPQIPLPEGFEANVPFEANAL